jgi:hypothetical protein
MTLITKGITSGMFIAVYSPEGSRDMTLRGDIFMKTVRLNALFLGTMFVIGHTVGCVAPLPVQTHCVSTRECADGETCNSGFCQENVSTGENSPTSENTNSTTPPDSDTINISTAPPIPEETSASDNPASDNPASDNPPSSGERSSPVCVTDNCGVCDLEPTNNDTTCTQDCFNEWGGDAVEDCAGTCNGDAVVDCAGSCNGDAALDCAGSCNGDAVVDCAGTCNGDAETDECGECDGGGTSCSLPINVVAVVPSTLGFSDGELRIGRSWERPYTDLQRAIDEAADKVGSLGPQEIWVKAGTYWPTRAIINEDPRSKSFELKTGVEIYGGFQGAEANLADRVVPSQSSSMDPSVSTIFSGDFEQSPTNSIDNSYHVVVASGVSESVLNGVTLTSGYAKETEGITPVSDLIANIFDDRFRGGAMLLTGSSLRIERCNFQNNVADIAGGAIEARNGSALTISLTYFRENRSFIEAGAIHSVDIMNVSIDQSVFVENEGPKSAAIYQVNGSLQVTQSTFVANISSGGGGSTLDLKFLTSGRVAQSAFIKNVGDVTLELSDSPMELEQSTVAFNDNSVATILAFAPGSPQLSVHNSVMWPETSGKNPILIFPSEDELEVSYSALPMPRFGSQINAFGTGTVRHLGVSPFEDEPSPGPDGIWATPDDILAVLSADSLAVDAGGVSGEAFDQDLRDQSRIQGDTIDMGAYENEALLTAFPDQDGDGVADSVDNCPAAINPRQIDVDDDLGGNICDADFDQDGSVTQRDHDDIFLKCFNGTSEQPELCKAADMNADGTVTSTDFTLFLVQFNSN